MSLKNPRIDDDATLKSNQPVYEGDSRLTDQRVPTNNSVDDTKVSSLSQSKIASLISALAGKVETTLFPNKGSLAVGFSTNTPSTLTVGTNGQVLTADSTQTLGVKWADPAASGGGTTWHMYVDSVINPQPPSNSLGSDGDYARGQHSGIVYGPKVSGAWPTKAALFTMEQSRTAGSLQAGHRIGGGVVWGTVASGIFEGDLLSASSSNLFSSTTSGVTWDATNQGWRVAGTMTQIFGTTYDNNEYFKGGSLYFKIKKLNTAGWVTYAGVGMAIGKTILPSIKIDSSGNVSWNSAAGPSGTLITVAVNDEVYMSGVNGKYDLLIMRGSTVRYQGVCFYTALGEYTLGGTFGLVGANDPGGTTYPDASQCMVVSNMTMAAGF